MIADTQTVNVEDAEASADGTVEAVLRGMTPAAPSAVLMERLLDAIQAETGMTADVAEVPEISDMLPTTVPEDKLNRWARLMDDAAREVTEERLKELKAAPPSDFKLMRWLMSVENTSTRQKEEKSRLMKTARRHLGLWAMSAAATFLVIIGVLSLYGPHAGVKSSLVKSGDIQRETVDYVAEDLEWNAEMGVAQKKYNVHYKDTVEITDANGGKTEISVPSVQKVIVPVAIY